MRVDPDLSPAVPKPYRMEEYEAVANAFYEEGYRRIRSSRDRAWIVAAVAAVLTGMALTALMLMTPLKRVDLLPVVVDRSTGEARVINEVRQGEISQEESIRKADLAAYIIARESFDRGLMKHYYQAVRSRSSQPVLDPYEKLLDPAVPQSLFQRYRDSIREIEVRSVVLLGAKLGQVRYTATLQRNGAPADRQHFLASVGFDYVTEPLEWQQRLRNPLGFIVTSYRVDQESLPPETKP